MPPVSDQGPQRLYRIREAAEILGLRPVTVYKLISTKAIAVIRPTRRAVRIPEQELLRIQRDGLVPRREVGAAAVRALQPPRDKPSDIGGY